MINSVLDSITELLASWRKARVHAERRIFFRRIVERITIAPDPAAIKFGQHIQLQNSKIVECLTDVEAGILYIVVESTFEGRTGQHSYSIFVTGDLFRIGLLLYGGLESAPLTDWQNEITEMWPGCSPDQHDRGALAMYEWTFLLPDLYQSFVTQERYILGIRHMHCRVLRIIQDFRKVQAQEGEAPVPR